MIIIGKNLPRTRDIEQAHFLWRQPTCDQGKWALVRFEKIWRLNFCCWNFMIRVIIKNRAQIFQNNFSTHFPIRHMLNATKTTVKTILVLSIHEKLNYRKPILLYNWNGKNIFTTYNVSVTMSNHISFVDKINESCLTSHSRRKIWRLNVFWNFIIVSYISNLRFTTYVQKRTLNRDQIFWNSFSTYIFQFTT